MNNYNKMKDNTSLVRCIDCKYSERYSFTSELVRCIVTDDDFMRWDGFCDIGIPKDLTTKGDSK